MAKDAITSPAAADHAGAGGAGAPDHAASADPEALYGALRSVRKVFNGLTGLSDAIHRDTGITAGMRAIMEQLALDGPQTVPEIARARSVSRQHVQVVINMLVEREIVSVRANPAHRRSSLIELTVAGGRQFEHMREAEAAWLDRLGRDLDTSLLVATRGVLETLDRSITEALNELSARSEGGHDGPA